MADEKNILHETANLYLYDTGKALEIRLNGATHAVLVGNAKTIDGAKTTMDRLEKGIDNLRKFLQHW